MSNRKIIGFAGAIAAGKTTAANHLVKTAGAVKLSFADAVKREAADFLHDMGVEFRPENLWGTQDEKDEKFFMSIHSWCVCAPMELFTPAKELLDQTRMGYVGLTFRQLLQLWGTDYRREQDPDYWVHRLWETLPESGLITIDDVRFPNEVQMVRDVGGSLVKIVRPDLETGSAHASETALDRFANWDAVIENRLDESFFRLVEVLV